MAIGKNQSMSIVLIVIGVLLIYFYTRYRTELERQDGIKGEFYSDGVTPKFSYTKMNGKFNGEWKSFYSNGKIKEIKHFSEGILDGKLERYDINGNVAEQGLYLFNKKEGRWETFYDNGDVKTVRQFQNGIEDKSYYCEFNRGAVTQMTQEEIDKEEFQDYRYTLVNEYNNSIDEIEKGVKYSTLERIYYESELQDQLSNDVSLKLKTQEHINYLKSRGVKQRDIGSAIDILMSREKVLGRKLDFEGFINATIEFKGKFVTQEIYEGLILIYEISGREFDTNPKVVYNKLF